MTPQQYCKYKKNIKSGDLLIWKKSPDSLLGTIFLYIIRFFTLSEYAHVGIALRLSGRLFVVEATVPKVRIALLSMHDEFYHVPMKIKWRRDYETFLLEKIGESYSFFDAIKGYFGIVDKEQNDDWQCAILANAFYKQAGLDFGEAYTPAKLVAAVLEDGSTNITSVRAAIPVKKSP